MASAASRRCFSRAIARRAARRRSSADLRTAVIAPRLAAVAVIGDNQAMEIKVKPVLDRPQSTLATSLLARASAAPSRLVQSPIATSLCGIWHE